MIVPDVNLLLYATIDTFPHHERARKWWEETINSDERIGLVDPVIFGFLRISTNPRILKPPLSMDAASDHVSSWFSQPNVERLTGGPEHIRTTLELLRTVGTAGNLTTDSRIGALAREHRAIDHSCDTDFARFPGVEYVNPLQ